MSQTISSICSPWKSFGGKMSCFSGLDLWGLGWGNCAIGVGNKLCAGGSDDACEENL